MQLYGSLRKRRKHVIVHKFLESKHWMHHFPSLLTDLSPVRGNASAHETRARSRFSSESCTPWLTQKCGRRLGETPGGGRRRTEGAASNWSFKWLLCYSGLWHVGQLNMQKLGHSVLKQTPGLQELRGLVWVEKCVLCVTSSWKRKAAVLFSAITALRIPEHALKEKNKIIEYFIC